MKKEFAKFLLSKLEKEKESKLKLLTADLGFCLFESISEKYPQNFLNVGIAESAMVGMAAGLAKVGYIPFVYSIAPFLYLRAFEQIKLDVDWEDLNVKFVGVGAGVGYAQAGVSHYSLEDFTLMSTLVNMKVFSPADSYETRLCLEEMYQLSGPCYLRLAQNEGEIERSINFVDKNSLNCLEILKGKKIAICSTGPRSAYWARQLAVLKDAQFGLYHFPLLKPFPDEMILQFLKSYGEIWAIQDQYVNSGLSQEISRLISTHGISAKLVDLGFKKEYPKQFGDVEYLRKIYISSDEEILKKIKKNYLN